MVAKDFLRELDRTREEFRWEYMHNNSIRGFLKTDPTRTAFDPIAAIGFGKIGQSSLALKPREIAAKLGLSPFDCVAILDASDGLLWKEQDGRMVLDGYCEWLRDGIALAVGLVPFDEVRAGKAAEFAVGLVSDQSTLERQSF